MLFGATETGLLSEGDVKSTTGIIEDWNNVQLNAKKPG
jgi:hypothetical protein